MSTRSSKSGFTLVEVLLAVVLLTVGVLALVGTSAMTTRMIGRGRLSTMASQVATARIERLRQYAASTAAPCTHAEFKTDSNIVAGAITEHWVVPNAGVSRQVTLTLTYPVARGTATEIYRTTVLCK
jgi:prepilin-type N-terminal cleavage/methylation domain-containing protein